MDAIVLDYHLGLLDGAAVAAEIKQIKPQVPIVMLADNLELPDGALKSVDADVAKSDGPHFLLETIKSALCAKSTQTRGGETPAADKPDREAGTRSDSPVTDRKTLDERLGSVPYTVTRIH